MSLAVETSNLQKSFGEQIAVDQVDLHIPCGAVYGFLGRNGAGKTTTIRLLLGLLRPDGGTVRLLGHDLGQDRLAALLQVGALVETPSHYDHLTGRQNLDVTRRLLALPPAETDRVLELVGLKTAADRRVGGYSLGMRQRLGVARAMLGSPRLLVLDEPTNGLDPYGIADMRALLTDLPRRCGTTVLISSHILLEVEQCATHVGLMHAGRLLLQSSMHDLKREEGRQVTFRVDRPQQLMSILAESGIASAPGEGPGEVQVAPAVGNRAADAVPQITFLMVEAGIAVHAVEVREPCLDAIFRRLTHASKPTTIAA